MHRPAHPVRSKPRRLQPLLIAALLPFALPPFARAQAPAADLHAIVEERAAAIDGKVVAWRRDIHEHPELGNREFRTAQLVAEHLRALGMDVQTEVAHTGVVGILRGGRPGPLVALRADMDALPVTEMVDLPFASKVRAQYSGQDVGVMHACGHDTHVAILMGVAELLAGMRDELPGNVMFIFQPAEEGPPPGEEGGAALMLEEGLFATKPAAVFGLHTTSSMNVGTIGYRAGGMLASADQLGIVVRGRQTHGAYPWQGVDPVLVSAHIVTALQSVVSRRLDITTAPAVVTIAQINGGVRWNIIPDSVMMGGTIRALDPAMRASIHEMVKRTAEHVAASFGATAEVTIPPGLPVTMNDPALTEWGLATLRRVAGTDNVVERPAVLGAEDFSFYAEQVPGMFIWLGGTPADVDPTDAPANHSPLFYVDEAALPLGMRALAGLAVDYMQTGGAGGR